MNRKVTVVGGAGNVGATVARGIAEKQLADVVVIDIADQKAAGVALDMLEACPIYGSDARVIGTGDYAESANSDIVVITSGVPRKPGMSRDDLLNVNYKIMQAVTEQVVKYSPNCIIIPVSNPLDAMAQAVYKLIEVPARARHRHGRRARLGAHAHVHREGAERVGRERPRVRARRPRRHDGAAAALLDGRRHSDHRPDGQGDASTRSATRTAERRRRDHASWSARARGTRPARRSSRWSRRSCSTRRRSCRARCSCRANTACATCSSACRASSARAALEKIIEIKLTPEEDAAFKKSAAAVKELVDVIGV